MSPESPTPAEPRPDAPNSATAAPAALGEVAPAVPSSGLPAWVWAGGVLTLLSGLALAFAWSAQQRVKTLEQQLVARQQQSQGEAAEALMLARQSQDATRDALARMALLEARVAEAAVQRGQLDELIQSLNRSRDENLLADVEAALRVAQQQSALTGSLEPLVSALRQADERLARYNQPRLERVRRAVLRDLERVRAVAQVDVSSLVIRLDEVTRQIDELPLTGVARAPDATPATPSSSAPASSGGEAAPAHKSGEPQDWARWLQEAGRWSYEAAAVVWREVRSLVRISRIDNPESVLVAPEQQFFLRENLKLRLLNARLALMSRQFDLAQSDLRDAQRSLERYFDPAARRVTAAQELLQQVARQARQVSLPRPDETLAALASVNAGR